MRTTHKHSISAPKICCPLHVFEMVSVLKQQNRMNEVGNIIKRYLETHNTIQIMVILKDNIEVCNKFLKMCNDEICRYLQSSNI